MKLPSAGLGTPAAFRGFAPFCVRGRRVARICMDCSDRRQAEQQAIAQNQEMTHTLCGPHAFKRMQEITGEKDI